MVVLYKTYIYQQINRLQCVERYRNMCGSEEAFFMLYKAASITALRNILGARHSVISRFDGLQALITPFAPNAAMQ